MMRRVLVLGGAGMLGHKLCQVLRARFETFATFRDLGVGRVFENVHRLDHIDVLDQGSLEHAFATADPAIVLNAIGLVKQHENATDPIASIQLNSLLPHRVANLAANAGSVLIQFSTDCVFSGRKGDYTENDLPDPVDLYGRSKLLGEVEAPHALTIRTSIIGRELGRRQGLVEWFLGKTGSQVSGYRNAIFSGLTTLALADVVAELLDRQVPIRGVWHVSSTPISKYSLLVKLNEVFDAGITIHPDDETICDRSLRSDRFWSSTGLVRPDWDSMIAGLHSDSVDV
jgi:dTDP-4-dehydrorhamnose reductase